MAMDISNGQFIHPYHSDMNRFYTSKPCSILEVSKPSTDSWIMQALLHALAGNPTWIDNTTELAVRTGR